MWLDPLSRALPGCCSLRWKGEAWGLTEGAQRHISSSACRGCRERSAPPGWRRWGAGGDAIRCLGPCCALIATYSRLLSNPQSQADPFVTTLCLACPARTRAPSFSDAATGGTAKWPRRLVNGIAGGCGREPGRGRPVRRASAGAAAPCSQAGKARTRGRCSGPAGGEAGRGGAGRQVREDAALAAYSVRSSGAPDIWQQGLGGCDGTVTLAAACIEHLPPLRHAPQALRTELRLAWGHRPALLLLALALLAARAVAQQQLWFLSADGSYNYSAHPEPLIWDAAEAACVAGGGHLLYMANQQEWDWVMPRVLSIWKANFPNIQPGWGDDACYFLPAGWRTSGSDAAWQNVEGQVMLVAAAAGASVDIGSARDLHWQQVGAAVGQPSGTQRRSVLASLPAQPTLVRLPFFPAAADQRLPCAMAAAMGVGRPPTRAQRLLQRAVCSVLHRQRLVSRETGHPAGCRQHLAGGPATRRASQRRSMQTAAVPLCPTLAQVQPRPI